MHVTDSMSTLRPLGNFNMFQIFVTVFVLNLLGFCVYVIQEVNHPCRFHSTLMSVE